MSETAVSNQMLEDRSIQTDKHAQQTQAQAAPSHAVQEAVAQMLATLPPVFRNLKHQMRTAPPGDSLKDMGEMQVWVLHALAAHTQLTSELARHFNVTNPTMTRIVDALVEKGYVERQHDLHDRRCIYLRLTEAGAEIASHAQDQMFTSMASFLSPLSEEQLHDIVVACRHLQSLLSESAYDLSSFCPAQPQQNE